VRAVSELEPLAGVNDRYVRRITAAALAVLTVEQLTEVRRRLDELDELSKDRAEKVRSAFRATARNDADIGNDLAAARAELGHAEWLAMLRDDLHMTERTARQYMAAASRVETLTAAAPPLGEDQRTRLAALLAPKDEEG
jgi:hypothetical protein